MLLLAGQFSFIAVGLFGVDRRKKNKKEANRWGHTWLQETGVVSVLDDVGIFEVVGTVDRVGQRGGQLRVVLLERVGGVVQHQIVQRREQQVRLREAVAALRPVDQTVSHGALKINRKK